MVLGVWDSYKARLEAKGSNLREVRLRREHSFINRKLPSSLSYHTAIVNGEEQQLAIINSDTLDVKTVCSLPGEDIQSGSLVEWAENIWLVVGEDVNKELYTRVVMQQCNHLLKWITEDGEIVERWCIVADGTTHLVGITRPSRNDNAIYTGDSRISMFIARDQYTIRLNRSNRFLIDDGESPDKFAYSLTKPFKMGGIYNGRGVMRFVLSEVNTEKDDNIELGIADYYKHFPRAGTASSSAFLNEIQESDVNIIEANDKRRVWF